MSVARIIAKGFGGFLFVTALALAISTVAMVQFTDFSNLKGPITNMFAQTMESSLSANNTNQTAQLLDNLKSDCAKGPATISQSLGNMSVTLKCTDVNAANESNILVLIAGNFIEQLYNKTYSCSYIDCLRSNMPFEEKALMAVMSAQAHDFYGSVLIYLLIVVIIGGVLMAWGAGSVPAAIRAFGWSFLVIGIGYFGLGLTRNLTPVPTELQAAMTALLDPLFATLAQYFLYSLVAGVALLVVGYTLWFIKRKKKE
jgi:hypothetical protein